MKLTLTLNLSYRIWYHHLQTVMPVIPPRRGASGVSGCPLRSDRPKHIDNRARTSCFVYLDHTTVFDALTYPSFLSPASPHQTWQHSFTDMVMAACAFGIFQQQFHQRDPPTMNSLQQLVNKKVAANIRLPFEVLTVADPSPSDSQSLATLVSFKNSTYSAARKGFQIALRNSYCAIFRQVAKEPLPGSLMQRGTLSLNLKRGVSGRWCWAMRGRDQAD